MQKTTSDSQDDKNQNKTFSSLAAEVYELLRSSRLSSSSEILPIISKYYDKSYHPFKKQDLLLEAFVHTSFIHEFPWIFQGSNQRLEFLGDSILECLISKTIVVNFPEMDEGELSKLRGALVNENSLSELALQMNLGRCLLLGKGEIQEEGTKKKALLADAFEALTGAVFLDSSYEGVEAYFEKVMKKYKFQTGKDFIDPERFITFDSKTKLQEKTMELYKVLPEYKITDLKNLNFKADLYIKKILVASETSTSKKKAEQKVAEKALNQKLYVLKGE